MIINSKESLHQVLDDMMESFRGEPYEIGLCNSYRKYDDDLYWFGEYKGLRITFYSEWFAEKKIAIN
jgi:hypothetical protein